jgi:hypothetical protein
MHRKQRQTILFARVSRSYAFFTPAAPPCRTKAGSTRNGDHIRDSRRHGPFVPGVIGPLAMSGVILLQAYSATNSLNPGQEKRRIREPEVLILKSE